MTKKILCFFLSFIFIISSVSFVLAEDVVPASDLKHEEANVKFAKAMGFIDASADQQSPVTRLELAKLVSKILLYDISDLEDADFTNVFSDVKHADSPYVMTAVNAGILDGVGNGKFAPDEYVTYVQLVKTMICILGREDLAEAKGGYPTGYLLVATQLSITDDAPPDMNYVVNIIGVCNMLKQMINCGMAYVDNNGNLEEYDDSYLSYYCSIGHLNGLVDACAGLSLSDKTFDSSVLSIDGKMYFLQDDFEVSQDMLGCMVDVYYTNKGNKNKIVYVEQSDVNSIKIDSANIESVSENGYTYIDGEKERTISITNASRILYNNQLVGSYTLDVLNPFKKSSLDGNVVLIDVNEDKIYDIVKITAYDSYVVTEIQDNTVCSKSGKFFVDLTKLEDDSIVNILKQPLSPDSIEPGDIINVQKNCEGKIVQIIVSIDTLSGIIDGVVYDDNTVASVEIDGRAYSCTTDLMNSKNIEELSPGIGAKVYFNPDGRIFEIDPGGYDSRQVGYLIDAKQTTGLDSSCQLKLLTIKDGIQGYTLADKVAVSVGSSPETVVSAMEALDAAGTTSGKIKRQPIFYELNSNDKISKIAYPDITADTKTDGFYRYPAFDGVTDLSGGAYYYRASAMSFGAKVLMSENTKVFAVASESERNDDDLYYVSTTSSLKSGYVKNKLEAYGSSANNPVADIIIIPATAGGAYTVDENSDIIVVAEISNVINADGDKEIKIKGYGYSGEVIVQADYETMNNVCEGDIVRLAYDSKNFVKKCERVFSCDSKSLVDLPNPSQDTMYTAARFSYGTVTYSDDYAFTVRIGEGDSAIFNSYPIGKFKKIVVDSSGKDLQVYIDNLRMLFGEQDYGKNASTVFVHTASADCRTLVIYE